MAVLLVGHGSEISPHSSRPVRALARALRTTGRFAEVRTAFWKEEPYLQWALDQVETPDVVVVPVFTSEGYFTTRLVPRELGIERRDRTSRFRIRMARPVGTHPRMAEIVLARAREAAALAASEEAKTVLVVLGHGTERHPDSGGTTSAIVEAVRTMGGYRDVVPAFLDQDPGLEVVLDRIGSADRVVVPFFISEGWHVGTTIPRDLAMDDTEFRPGGGALRYAKPIGTHPAMVGVVLEIVEETLAGDGRVDRSVRPSVEELPGCAAKRDFLAQLGDLHRTPGVFLQVAILPAPSGQESGSGAEREGAFELRHVSDVGRAASELVTYPDPSGAEDLGARTEDGAHRPLRTAPTLTSGWRLANLDGEGVWQCLGHLYPGAAVHDRLARLGALSITAFGETASRHTGMYAGLGALAESDVLDLAARCCAPNRCLRVPVWDPLIPENVGGVPCPEACPVFLAMALEAGTREG